MSQGAFSNSQNDLHRYDIICQEESFPRMHVSRKAVIESPGTDRKQTRSSQRNAEQTVSDSFEQATDKISPIKQNFKTELVNVKTVGSFGILTQRCNQKNAIDRQHEQRG